MRRLFTIGYEGTDPERLVAALKGAGIGLVADVRAVAISRKRGFSKGALREHLADDGIAYRHFIDLGTPKAGREAARAGDVGTLRRIYDEQLATAGAVSALDDLARITEEGPVCLLCFERDPARCHRTIVAERLRARGFEAVDLQPL